MSSRRRGIGVGFAVTAAWLTAGIGPPADLLVSRTPFAVKPAAAYDIGELSPEDFRLYRKAFELARNGHWKQAQRTASQAQEPLLHKVLLWLEYGKAGGDGFETIADFIDRNPHWPRLETLKRRAEDALDDGVPAAVVLDWFRRHDPVSAQGAVRYAEALVASGADAEGTRRLREIWIEGTFSAGSERDFLKRHRGLLTETDHLARLDRLLWDGHTRSARRMLRRVDKGWQALAMARMALRRSAPGVDWAVAQVPDRLKDDPGLIYERLRWRLRKGKIDGALEMLMTAPDPPPHAEMWWRERAYLARMLLARGDVADAYLVAGRHGQGSGVGLAEGEWLAGWIALRFQGDHGTALNHFKTVYDSVSYPISRTRGAYWAGRAAEAMGDQAAARDWYRLAAAHPTVFYGQHAAARLGPDFGAALPDGPAISASEMEEFHARELVRVVRLLAEIGENRLVRAFVRHLSRIAETPAERILLARLAQNADRTDLAVWTARRASLAGVNLIDHGYPMLPLPAGQGPDPALVHAVIRQESGFDPRAVSPIGARGLMQLMPSTARMVSHRLRARYSKHRLTADPDYNVTLGQAHLAALIEAFDGSYVMALAAYNAGPSRVKRWVETYGDPRRGSAEAAIDWIESIPLDETRNYVQRVLEGLFVYRLRFDQANIVVTMGDRPR